MADPSKLSFKIGRLFVRRWRKATKRIGCQVPARRNSLPSPLPFIREMNLSNVVGVLVEGGPNALATMPCAS